ncbi:MAG: hypothetical protein H6Q67_729 [Firmicutes bacterium]|nr:hypothetical protein [Bacillota bacterium]
MAYVINQNCVCCHNCKMEWRSSLSKPCMRLILRNVAEIQRYNEFCTQGRDTGFYKDPQGLVPIENGPFYAFYEGGFPREPLVV